MLKKGNEFICDACGAKFPKWSGRCSHCGKWDSLKEHQAKTTSPKAWTTSTEKPLQLNQVEAVNGQARWETKVREFDRVTGGGIVRGSFGLLGGNPGVGKSTLILQLLGRLDQIGCKTLYISGEESASQIKQRADRLLIQQENILILIESSLERILEVQQETKPDFIVIDSIQTLFTEQFSAGAGSITQVRETAAILMRHAKSTGTAAMLIGHVTKEGDLAGPRTLEHMVDYVLYLEGEKKEQQRVLRSVKNRFGSISEIGLFKMTPKGLAEVVNPHTLYLDHLENLHPGTAFFAAFEGTRTLFMEIQVLVGDTQQSYPARTTVGIDRNRLQVIIAVLEKHLQMDFSRNDVYVNLAGGFKVQEPAIDLAITAALLSSHLRKPLAQKSVFAGELALNGEIRHVPSLDERLNESTRCGFEHFYYPARSKKLKNNSKSKTTLIPLKNLNELMDLIG